MTEKNVSPNEWKPTRTLNAVRQKPTRLHVHYFQNQSIV